MLSMFDPIIKLLKLEKEPITKTTLFWAKNSICMDQSRIARKIRYWLEFIYSSILYVCTFFTLLNQFSSFQIFCVFLKAVLLFIVIL